MSLSVTIACKVPHVVALGRHVKVKCWHATREPVAREAMDILVWRPYPYGLRTSPVQRRWAVMDWRSPLPAMTCSFTD
eukprot:351362-Chlamydomonas_euryale.AAC.5